MGLGKRLRVLQDMSRNAGWRIQWIPWSEPDKPQMINNNSPLSLIGILMFLGSIGYLCWMGGGMVPIMVAVVGLITTMSGIVHAAISMHNDWVRLEAQCVDRELKRFRQSRKPVWAYRLVCEFDFADETYRVTPNPSHLVAFSTEQRLKKYLEDRIQPNGHCCLWVNPDNPLQTIFHKKIWWLQ